MKMTSGFGNGDVTAARKDISDYDPNAPLKKAESTSSANRSEAKHRLTFSIDSLVGKNAKGGRQEIPEADDGKLIKGNFSEGSKSSQNRGGPSRSPSPSPKRHCPELSQQPMQQSHPKMTVLSKTPPANAPELSILSDQQRFMRQSAFMPPSVSSGPSASSGPSYVSPVPLTGPSSGNRLCWDLASVEPGAGLWKDAMAASAMYQAAAAAALYTGYHPWYSPSAPITSNDLAKKQQLLLQQEQQSMAFLASPPETMAMARSVDPRQHVQPNPSQPAGMISSAAEQQSQTFWHHHIAELLRQNGGHPVHHSRLYPGPDAGHAAASFLFSGCRKPKRIRTAFSPNQLMELEAAFEKNQYVVGNERKDLARRLALTETQVKVWFQNRRTKAKRMKNDEPVGTPGAASTSSSTSSTVKLTTTTGSSYQTDDGVRPVTDKETLEISGNGQKLVDGLGCGPLSVASDAEEQDHGNEEEENETESHSSGEESN